MNVLADGTIKVKDQVMNAAQLTAMLAADGAPDKTELTIATDKAAPFSTS